MPEENILVNISDEHLPQLAEIYREHIDWAPNAYNTVITAIDWRKKSPENYSTFMSPYGCWKEDGTFFVLFHYHCSMLFIFTLDRTGKNVYEALRKTTLVEKINLFYCVHSSLYPVICRIVKERELKVIIDDQNYMFRISKEEALKYEIDCPPEVYIRRLEKTHAPILNEIWPHRFKDSEKLISMLIDMKEGYGVFLKSNDELVSWIITFFMGQLGMLQTKEGHKRKGYASLITKYMSKELAKKGQDAFGTVIVSNTASVAMFKRLGFNIIGYSYYVGLETPDGF